MFEIFVMWLQIKISYLLIRNKYNYEKTLHDLYSYLEQYTKRGQ